MPRVSCLNTKNVSLAYEYHTSMCDSNNAKLDKVFSRVIFFMSHGYRNFTYKEIADMDNLKIGTVSYYFRKLVHYGAITLEE